MGETEYPEADHGWSSTFPRFHETPAPYIRDSLARFLRDVSLQQLDAWDDSIAPLQREVGEVLRQDPAASDYSAIFEYQLPLEHRRPDAILLIGGAVLVLEFKGKAHADLADLDQASRRTRGTSGHTIENARSTRSARLLF